MARMTHSHPGSEDQMKPFIRIGSLSLNRNDIIEVDHNYVKFELCEENDPLHYVRVTTRALAIGGDAGIPAIASVNVHHDFLHGTKEAQALLSWLEAQTEVLA